MALRLRSLGLVTLVVVAAASAACGSDVTQFASGGAPTGAGGGDSSTSGNPTATTGSVTGTSSTGQGGAVSTSVTATGVTTTGTASGCNPGVDEDQDQDGASIAQGDCNDCDPNVGPNSVEVVDMGAGGGPSAPADEDCDGVVDNLPPPCDAALAIDTGNALDAARAIELCKASTGPSDWGVSAAKWVLADGSPPPVDPNQLAAFHLGHGVLGGFGPNVGPRGGARLLGLSSGTARQPTDPGYMAPGGYSKGFQSAAPQGFPKESPACPNTVSGTPWDAAGLEVTVLAPTNAFGFSFDFAFYTYEWPSYICSAYNDFFVAMLSPIPAGQTDGNISFDSMGNPVSVNNAFLDACSCANGPPCLAGGKTFDCPLGNTPLLGTGFDAQAATGWLVTKAPAAPGGVITVRFTVYDSGDGVLDSSVLVDHWQWIATPGTVVDTGEI